MKKITALILVVIFLMDLTSCYSYHDITEQKDYESFQDKPNVKVLYLSTKQYKTIYFSEKFPGKILNGEVIGPHHVLLNNFKPDSIIYKNLTQTATPIAQYAFKNGTKYEVIFQDYNKLICLASDTTRIPFSEIKQIHIKKLDSGSTAGLILAVAGAIGLVIYLIVVNLTFDIDMGGW
jgi:hypothetical protein